MAPRLLSCFAKGNDSSARNQNHANVTVDVSAEEQHRGGAVLVELFSSQGCKTSPEAELLVSRLGRGDFQLEMPVIVLAFHVDYWDYMGWKDPYGGSQWTVRQKAYVESLKLDTMFTPQIVVQGRTQCVGNEEEALLSSIVNAPRFPAPTFQNLQGRTSGPAATVAARFPTRLRHWRRVGSRAAAQTQQHGGAGSTPPFQSPNAGGGGGVVGVAAAVQALMKGLDRCLVRKKTLLLAGSVEKGEGVRCGPRPLELPWRWEKK
nr:uncharacterized protein LOC118063063 [Populus alba]